MQDEDWIKMKKVQAHRTYLYAMSMYNHKCHLNNLHIESENTKPSQDDKDSSDGSNRDQSN